MDAFTKTIQPGSVKEGKTFCKMFCKIEWDGERLSITGVVGPLKSGNARGSCGQIIMCFKEYDHRGYMTLGDLKLNPPWNRAILRRFFDTWKRWHLNDMKAGSQPQEEYLRSNPDVFEGIVDYNLICKTLAKAGLNPDANGYKYGSKWIREDVPSEVVEFLASLPESTVVPAWV